MQNQPNKNVSYDQLKNLESSTACVNGTTLITLCVPSGSDI